MNELELNAVTYAKGSKLRQHQMREAVSQFLHLKIPWPIVLAWVEPPGAFVHGKPTAHREPDSEGVLDGILCYEGFAIFLELKTQNDRLRQSQGEFGNRLLMSKGIGIVIHEATWVQDCGKLVGMLTQSTGIVPPWWHYAEQLGLDIAQWPRIDGRRLPAPGERGAPKDVTPSKPATGLPAPRKSLPPPE